MSAPQSVLSRHETGHSFYQIRHIAILKVILCFLVFCPVSASKTPEPSIIAIPVAEAATTSPELLAKVPQIDELSPDEDVRALIPVYALKWGVSEADMYALIDCETGGTFDPKIQSKALRPDGSQENSWGIAQIFLDAHPDITKEQAQDARFSLDFIGSHFSKKRFDPWLTCWAKIQKNKQLQKQLPLLVLR